jgi:hypothetical protein
MVRKGKRRRQKDGSGDVCAEEGMKIGVVEV